MARMRSSGASRGGDVEDPEGSPGRPEELAVRATAAVSLTLGISKVRGFVVDVASGRPVPGVVVTITATVDEGVDLTIGPLASDLAGYVSFDLSELRRTFKQLCVSTIGPSSARVDLRMPAALNWPGPHFVLLVDGSQACKGRPAFPAVMSPDQVDWRLSPRSFASRPDITLDGCASGCEQLVPSTVATRDYRIRRVVRRWADPPAWNEGWNNLLTPLDPMNVPFNEGEHTSLIAHGEVLEFRQRWIPLGHSLGEILYSLPLAPCESVNIAVIDWSRQDTAVRQDQARGTEALAHRLRRDRTIEDTLEAALNESQGGWSLMAGMAQATSAQQASSGEASATVPIEGIPVSLAGAASQSLGLGQLLSVGGGIANSWGNRDLSGSSLQELHDTTRQATSLVRTFSSTVVVQTTQQEQSAVQTRTVSNHNHCHALTVQYYEVLRHFQVITEFVGRRPVVLIPYKVSAFDWRMALRFRAILEPLVDPRVRTCFDALVRLHFCPDIYALPAPTTEPDTGAGAGADSIVDDPFQARSISSFSVTLTTTSRNWATTWGEIWVDVWVKSKSGWQTIWHKDPVNKGASELNKLVFPQQASGQGIDPSDIDTVQVRWQEDNGNDSWDLKGITITYQITGETGTHTLIDLTGTSTPPGSAENAIRFFDNSGTQPLATQPLAVRPAPAPPAPSTGGGGTEHPPAGGARTPATRGKYSKEEDTCCEAQLLVHLNGNIGLFSRAIWLLQDPVERRVLLDQALVSKPWIAGGIDDTPLAVSGSHVAFSYVARDEEASTDGDRVPDLAPLVEIVSLLTRGVFAEAQLGQCNSCELRDVTRFWQWEESPCPDKAPTIEGIRPGPAGQPVSISPTTLPSPIVQIMSPPVAPDPTGLAAALNVLGTPGIFRDMSGLAEVSDLLQGLASGATTLAQAQEMASRVQQRLTGAARGGGVAGAGRSPPSEPDAGRQIDMLNAIKYARGENLIDDRQARNASEGVLGGSLYASADAGAVYDGSELSTRVERRILDAVAGQPRLKESFDQLVSEGWQLRRTSIYFSNSFVEPRKKTMYIDDDEEETGTVVSWVEDAVQTAFQGADDLRLEATRDKGLEIFRAAGPTDLEKMAQLCQWAVWFWRHPRDNGDFSALMDDLMLVLTNRKPDDPEEQNDRKHYIFSTTYGATADSTGFKRALRDDGNQVRHATGSLQVCLRYGMVGLMGAQARETQGTADWRLNEACWGVAQRLALGGTGWFPKDVGDVLRREFGDPSETGSYVGPADGDPTPP